MDDTGKLVRVEMTLDQADAMTQELDLANRISLGQIDEIAGLARMDRLFARDEREPEGYRRLTAAEIDIVENHCFAIMRLLGHSRSSSFGIGSKGLTTATKRGYEIAKVVGKVVADTRNPGGGTTRHSGLGPRYTQDPAPTAELIEKDATA